MLTGPSYQQFRNDHQKTFKLLELEQEAVRNVPARLWSSQSDAEYAAILMNYVENMPAAEIDRLQNIQRQIDELKQED